LISIFLLTLISAYFRARKSIPLLSKIFLGFILFTLFLTEYILSLFSNEFSLFYSEHYYKYQNQYYVLIGMVSFLVLAEIRIQNIQKRLIWKAIILIISTNLITALFVTNIFVPPSYSNPQGFGFIESRQAELWIRLLVLLSLSFGICGISLFMLQVSYLIVKSKLFSKWSSIFLVLGILSFLDCLITIPLIEMKYDVNIRFALSHWILSFVFIIAARLYRINIKVVKNIKELYIVYSLSGIPLFSQSSGGFEPSLVGSAMTGVVALLKEIWGSKKRIRSIDQGDKKLLFAFGQYTYGMILVEDESLILNKMLKELLNKFETNYISSLENFTGNLRVFDTADTIVDTVFPQVNWTK
jgi:hypothetical protein